MLALVVFRRPGGDLAGSVDEAGRGIGVCLEVEPPGRLGLAPAVHGQGDQVLAVFEVADDHGAGAARPPAGCREDHGAQPPGSMSAVRFEPTAHHGSTWCVSACQRGKAPRPRLEPGTYRLGEGRSLTGRTRSSDLPAPRPAQRPTGTVKTMLAALPANAGLCRFIRGDPVGVPPRTRDLWDFCGDGRPQEPQGLEASGVAAQRKNSLVR